MWSTMLHGSQYSRRERAAGAILLLAMCLSLMLTGPGLYALDLPL